MSARASFSRFFSRAVSTSFLRVRTRAVFTTVVVIDRHFLGVKVFGARENRALPRLMPQPGRAPATSVESSSLPGPLGMRMAWCWLLLRLAGRFGQLLALVKRLFNSRASGEHLGDLL